MEKGRIKMKAGIDYFSLDCHLNKKMQLIEAEFGLKGFAVVIKLYQMIYGEEGYYCKWNEEVSLLFSRKNCNLQIGDKFVSEVVNAGIKRGIFSEQKYKQHGILTSEEIQITYFEIAKRRLKVEAESKYLLISEEQIPQNVYINKENVDRNPKNVDIFEQSKVKERKEICSCEQECVNDVEKEKKALQEKYFALFWEKYPKKVAKKEAQKAWKQLPIREKLYDEICCTVDKQKQEADFLQKEKQFIPNPATWLRGERWKDNVCDNVTPIRQQPKQDAQLEKWKKLVNGE